MKAASASERAEALRLADRAEHCAKLCRAMAELDERDLGSVIGKEVDTLTDVIRHLNSRCEEKAIRLSACLRLYELIFDLQEEGISDRCAELGIPVPEVKD